MRKIDDIIINTLNTVIPTDSFHANAVQGCKELHQQLEDGNVKRENFIRNCINISAKKVKHLKEQRDADGSNIEVSKNLRAEQTNVCILINVIQNINYFITVKNVAS